MPAAKRAASPTKNSSPKKSKPSPKKTTKEPEHNMNVNGCVDKKVEVASLKGMLKLNVGALEGVGPKMETHYNELGLKTIKDMGTWKYYKMAAAIVLLAETEEKGERHDGAKMNIDEALDKKFEKKTLKEVCKAPTACLQGVGPKAKEQLEALHINTVAQLANNKFFARAAAIVELAQYEA
ncbi:hypothetical protein DIPPA_25752 [Diplonema papillatum]|nr:hypothetical protein DIPPA_25752 [Diplonema papillatum]|eukprot:gene16278-24943_t